MLKRLLKKGGRKGKPAKQGAGPFDGTTPDPPGAARTNSQPHPTSSSSSPGPSLESLIAQTGVPHNSVSSPEVNSVAVQYATNRDLQRSLHWSHPLPLPTTAQQHRPPIPSTGTPFSTASMPALPRDHASSEPGIQFEGTNMRAIAGGDIGSKNILQQGGKNVLQQGERNEIHYHNAGPTDEHEALLRRIKEKIGPYIASDATLSKDVHGDPSVCYQGTREDLLEHVLSWVEGSPAQFKEDVNDVARRALCIVGAPGSGKSTIMNTLILDLLRNATRRSPGLIAAHYCIRRSLQSTTDSTKVLPTLILQLARRDLGIAKRTSMLLDEALHTDVFTPKLQEEVFLEAISAHNQVVFLIIDALDEASKPASLATTLSRIIPISPPNLRLLLATRNEHGVLQSLGKRLVPKIAHRIPTEDSVDEVGDYIAWRLEDGLGEIFGDDPSWCFWPDDSQLLSLSNKADGLYIWARTAVDFILSCVERRGEINRDLLIEDVGRVGMADVNTLYMFILKKCLPEDDAGDRNRVAIEAIKGVLGFIIIAEHPLPLDDIVGFLGYQDYDVRNFVRLARSILVPGVENITGATVPQFHKTLSDFLTSDRAEEFQIEVEDVHRSAASRCFELMDSRLCFNICGLRSSFSPDARMDELAASVPKGLIYASTSWLYHLTPQRNSGSQLLLWQYLPFLKTLLYEKLLFWLEIVSLSRKEMDSANWLITLADQLEDNQLLAHVNKMELSIYAKDASFLIKRLSKCIEASIPHIYISFLAFSSRDSVVANHYRKQIATTVIPHPSGLPPRWDSWDTDPRMADGSSVYSVSFSPCGRHLAAGYGSNSVWVWDVETGEYGIKPMKGHSDRVNSVCFSPSGLFIASGSDDKTIRVWDAETGKCMLGPLTGHTDCVWSVSFSPDSTRIASGSKDGTVRVWDVRTGDCVLGPLEEHSHTGDVYCVSYSPDGSCIASGSKDATIRLWNAQTGECICELLEGHEDWILSLSFHPDGRRLVSGSMDKTLRIWDIQTGTCTHVPLTGRTNSVLCVCLSPDGRYIASGSHDCNIRIWDGETAACIAGPFGGASDAVSSVAFSPDGKCLAAGSYDGTARLWDLKALLSAGVRGSAREDQVSTDLGITDHTAIEKVERRTSFDLVGTWTLGPNGERLFCASEPYDSAIWRPSTVRILGRPSMIKPDLSNLVTGEEWLSCFPPS